MIGPGANAELSPAFVDGHHELIATAQVVLTQLETPVESAAAAFAHARKSGALTLLNPAPADATREAPAATAEASDALKELLPKLSLEIRAAVDASLQKELASLRGFIGGAIDTHTERLHGDIAALLPEPRTPQVENTPIIAERSASKIAGWTSPEKLTRRPVLRGSALSTFVPR